MNAENWIAKFLRDPLETAREAWFELQKPHDRFSGSRMHVLYTAALILSAVFCGLYAWLTQAYWPVLVPLGIGALGLGVKVVGWAKMNFGGPSVFLEEPPKKKVGLLRWALWIVGYLVYEGVVRCLTYVEDYWQEMLESSLPSWIVIGYGLFHLAFLIGFPIALVVLALDMPIIAYSVAAIPCFVAYEVTTIINGRLWFSTLEAYFLQKYALHGNN